MFAALALAAALANTPAPALAVRLGPTDFAGATLDAAGLTGARWTGVRNLTLTGKLAGGFTCIDCANITFEGVHADGGLSLIKGGPFTVHRSDLTGAGIYAQRCAGLTISQTLIHDIGVSDLIDIPGCDDVDIQWNSLFRDRPAPAGSHPDAIQGWQVAGFHPKNIRIANNFILGASQGIFGVGADNLVIERNLIMVDFQNAIYPDVTLPATIADNTVASRPDGFAQATIIFGPLATIKGANTVGAWKAKPGFTVPVAP